MLKYKEVLIPNSPGEWELYSDMKDVEMASQGLTEASKRAINCIVDGKLSEARELPSRAMGILRDEMSKWARFGACDTEPNYHAELVVRNCMKVIAGLEWDGYC